jgi:hypothetical protein
MSGSTPHHPTISDQPLSESDIDKLLRAATLAPSLHNSQPWAFAFGSNHVEVYLDASRQLPNADPTGRSLRISCGAAIFNLRVAGEHLGFRPHLRLNPDPTEPTLVAVAKLGQPRPRPGPLDRFYPAIARRRTNRRPFRNQNLPYSVLAALDEAARAEGAILRIYNDPDEVCRIIELTHSADLADATEPGRTTERQAWVGGRFRDDGIPAGSLGPRPLAQRAAFRDLGQAVGIPRDYAQFEAAPTIAILSTVHDQPIDWVRAGQSLERLLLEATLAGVAASFLNQPLENDDLRQIVSSPASGVGHPQMIVRLGFGDEAPATPRRALSQVLRVPRTTPRPST